MKTSQLASIELLNGVLIAYGKKWLSIDGKEVGVERQWKKVDPEVNDLRPQPCLIVRMN